MGMKFCPLLRSGLISGVILGLSEVAFIEGYPHIKGGLYGGGGGFHPMQRSTMHTHLCLSFDDRTPHTHHIASLHITILCRKCLKLNWILWGEKRANVVMHKHSVWVGSVSIV